ncbi:MAG: nickel pincer cofactor biosynthesis protein LarB, partial [Desulfofustis sp.]|nr:nickel pincer cofactor biosynthesis protein LarB [Desulfofustis sp.]
MNSKTLTDILERVRNGTLDIEGALQQLGRFPAESVDGACIDHQRQLRTGLPEVIFGESKSVDQIVPIASAMLEQGGPVLVTRVDSHKASAVMERIPHFTFHKQARILQHGSTKVEPDEFIGEVVVVCAGTSDLGVAEEARVTIETLGHPCRTIYDAGVAGLHRILARHELLLNAAVIIVVAGMEGALPSVVGGLVSCPVIGVPTSIGYGAGIGGFAALLGMLNSCAPG